MTFPINPGAVAAETQTAAALTVSAKDAAHTVAGNLGDITDSIRAVRRWTSDRHNWVRVGWFVLGVSMMTIGVAMLGQRPATAALNTATKVAEVAPK